MFELKRTAGRGGAANRSAERIAAAVAVLALLAVAALARSARRRRARVRAAGGAAAPVTAGGRVPTPVETPPTPPTPALSTRPLPNPEAIRWPASTSPAAAAPAPVAAPPPPRPTRVPAAAPPPRPAPVPAAAPPPAPSRAIRPNYRRRRAVAVAAVIAVAAVVLTVLLSAGNHTANPGRGGTSTAAATGTATAPATAAATVEVTSRELASAVSASGKLGYPPAQTVFDRLGGRITALPAVGQVIDAGQTLFTVGGVPVVLLSGSVPATRALAPGVSNGPDVRQLNASLAQLGYERTEIVLSDAWQRATTLGVEMLQAHLGEARTGRLALGDVVFLPTPQIVTRRDTAVGVEASLAVEPAGAGGGEDRPRPERPAVKNRSARGAVSPRSPTAGRAAARDLSLATTTETATSPTTTAPSTAGTTQTVPPAAPAAPKPVTETSGASPSATSTGASSPSVTSTGETSTSPGGGATSTTTGGGATSRSSVLAVRIPVLSAAPATLRVTAQVSPELAPRAGSPATVVLPNGAPESGTVSSVGRRPSPSTPDASTSITVTVTFAKAITDPRLNHAAVSVRLRPSRPGRVMSVPTSALILTAGHPPAVREARPGGKLLPVRTGIAADGYVQISGPGIHLGLVVDDFVRGGATGRSATVTGTDAQRPAGSGAAAQAPALSSAS